MDKAIIALKQLLEASVAEATSPLNDIKTVFYGDPFKIPEDNLPALTIQPINTAYELRGSRYDEKIYSIEIRLVYNSKDYFGDALGSEIAISNITYSDPTITFTTSAAHGLSIGNAVKISGVDPDVFNGTYEVATAPNSTEFTVTKSGVTETYNSGGASQQGTADKVFLVEDAIKKVELATVNQETAEYTVCGTVQKNTRLPYTDGSGNPQIAATLAKVTSVSYTFSTERGFPTYESIVTLEIKGIGDR